MQRRKPIPLSSDARGLKLTKPAPEKITRQKQRLDELAALLPDADPQRGAKLFSNGDKSKCIIWHLKGKTGCPTGTRIGAIRPMSKLLKNVLHHFGVKAAERPLQD